MKGFYSKEVGKNKANLACQAGIPGRRGRRHCMGARYACRAHADAGGGRGKICIGAGGSRR
jgi:hypothetical protein